MPDLINDFQLTCAMPLLLDHSFRLSHITTCAFENESLHELTCQISAEMTQAEGSFDLRIRSTLHQITNSKADVTLPTLTDYRYD